LETRSKKEVEVGKDEFFREIEHPEVPWKEYTLHVPVFYPDIRFMSASFLAPLEKIRAILPSERMKPYRITPWHSTVSVTAYEYRECDLGPYNEVSIGVPVTLDRETPVFTGFLRKMPQEPMVYSHALPVSTEIARVVGAEFAGYPKFVANIEFTESDEWLVCELRADGQLVLTLKGRRLHAEPSPRYRLHPITYRRGYILRSEMIASGGEVGGSRSQGDVRLELGEHQIADELRELSLGRLLGFRYCAKMQGILTPVIESYAGD
jgi:hypothetical protein